MKHKTMFNQLNLVTTPNKTRLHFGDSKQVHLQEHKNPNPKHKKPKHEHHV